MKITDIHNKVNSEAFISIIKDENTHSLLSKSLLSKIESKGIDNTLNHLSTSDSGLQSLINFLEDKKQYKNFHS